MKKIKLNLLFIIIPMFSLHSQIFFSEYAEGSSYNKYLEIYNYTTEVIDLTNYAFPSCSNGCDEIGEWDYMNLFPDGATLAPADVYVITHPNATNPENEDYTAEIALHSNHTFTYLSNGDDIFALINIETGDILDVIGDFESGEDPGSGFDVAGVINATKDHTLVRKSTVVMGNQGGWIASAGTNTDDSEWIVLDNETWINLGFHEYDNSNQSILGCTDLEACNFNELATEDNGSCEYITDCLGECGGVAYFDQCGTCDADPFNDCAQPITGCSWCELAANYFDFNSLVTSSTMTILLPTFNTLIQGDVIGVFYIDQNGFIDCGGAIVYEGSPSAVALYGDDESTNLVDGFQFGDSFIFLVLRDGIVYDANVVLTNSPSFSNTYVSSGFGQVEDLIFGNQFIDECILPLGVGQNCDDVDISENIVDKKEIVIITDLFGRIIRESEGGFQIEKYTDGTLTKKYILKH